MASFLSRRVFDVQIRGLQAAIWRLRKLPDRIQRKILRSATKKGATIVARQVRKIVPLGTDETPPHEHLRDTITKTAPKLYRNSGTIIVVVGPEKQKAPHDHLVHDGTKPHKIVLGKSVQLGRVLLPAGFVINHPGSKPKPFLNEAVRSTQVKVLRVMRQTIWAGIDKEVKKLRKETGK